MDKNIFKEYVSKNIKIVLSNSFIYYGFVISVGDAYLKIGTNRGETLIILDEICSMEEVK